MGRSWQWAIVAAVGAVSLALLMFSACLLALTVDAGGKRPAVVVIIDPDVPRCATEDSPGAPVCVWVDPDGTSVVVNGPAQR